MFKRALLAFAAAAALLSPAIAADVLPVKAPLFAPVGCTISQCSGAYAGFGLTGNGAQTDVTAGGINSNIFAAGAMLDVHGGYQVWNGTWLFAVEAGIGNQFTNGPISGQLGSQTLVGYEGVKLGGTLSGLLGAAQTAGTTTPGQAAGALSVFSSLENQMISPYVWLGAIQRNGFSQGTTGVGMEYVVAQNWNLDARYVYAPALGNLQALQQITVGLNYHFSIK